MAKRFVLAVCVAVFVVCIQWCLALAQQDAQESRERLNKVRMEMTRIKYDYEEEVRKVNKECDDKIAVAKEEFHKIRNKALEEKKSKLTELNSAYKGKVRPMEAEEKSLLGVVSPAQGNFVKTKKK